MDKTERNRLISQLDIKIDDYRRSQKRAEKRGDNSLYAFPDGAATALTNFKRWLRTNYDFDDDGEISDREF